MISKRNFFGATGALSLAAALGWRVRAVSASPAAQFEVSYTDADWRKRLTPAQYSILRHEGTERPYSSALNDEHRHGLFDCAGCDFALFSSGTKFDSHTGWPSFYAPLQDAVATSRDTSFGTVRTEVHCRGCGSHIGHVFDDGPAPTGLRYCMNGIAMTFKAA